MDQATQKAGFDLVKRARQHLSSMAPSKISPATERGYEREFFDRLVGEHGRNAHDIWELACQTTSKRTYYRRVAAIRHGIHKLLNDYLPHQDKCQREEDWTAWHNDLNVISELLELERIVTSAAGACPLIAPKRRMSKRRHLHLFPLNWRDRLAAKFQGNFYEAAYLVSALTGCRPQELETGIGVSRTSDDVILTVLQGAKVKGNTQGQPFRSFKYDANHRYVVRLLEILNLSEEAEGTVQVSSKVSWTSAIRRAGRALWPGAKEVTSYLLRHALASDLKRQGWDPDEISAGLGHISTKTRSLYGHWSSGGKTHFGLKQIIGARPVHGAARASKPAL